GHFPEERVAHVARQICRALREAHSLGVIHRDLKPANIFLVEHGDETDFVKVLDFGLVKNVAAETKGDELTQTGLFMGSPKYMAPEQVRGDRVDARTDIYALGVIMYEMLTGKVPFDRPNSVNILMAHVNEDVPPMRQMNPNIQVSPLIEDAVARCMAKDPDNRFRSMDEVLGALKRVGGGALTQTITGLETGELRALTDGLSKSGSGPQVVPPSTPSGPLGGYTAGTRTSGIPVPIVESAPSSLAPDLPPVRRGLRGAWIATLLAAFAAVGMLGYSAVHPVSSATRTPPPAAPAAVTTPAPRPVAPVLVSLRIVTEPDGATVKEDGVEVCTSTPCDILYKGPDADPTRVHKLTFSRSGYRPESKDVKVGDAPLAVKLTKVPDAPRVVPVARPEAPPATAPPVPTGYKTDIPY
ncbi:MAG TPA: serine/threonine-protein kinase, partial [Polyangiaceae bacterium]|nr:serine/threonine-protein kinase [Polyangiaceae bacterium]